MLGTRLIGKQTFVPEPSLSSPWVVCFLLGGSGDTRSRSPSEAFINVDAPTLFSRAIEALPRERVVIELLETIAIDDDIVRRCRELKARGYRLALDDFVGYGEEYEPLLDIVDIVKIDVLQLSPQHLSQLVHRLRLWPPRLLAEKVETRQRARDCKALGFSLFQGFYFARPALLPM